MLLAQYIFLLLSNLIAQLLYEKDISLYVLFTNNKFTKRTL